MSAPFEDLAGLQKLFTFLETADLDLAAIDVRNAVDAAESAGAGPRTKAALRKALAKIERAEATQRYWEAEARAAAERAARASSALELERLRVAELLRLAEQRVADSQRYAEECKRRAASVPTPHLSDGRRR